jgi:hypothetical protein
MTVREAHFGIQGPIVPVVWYDEHGNGPFLVIVEWRERWHAAWFHAVDGKPVASPVALVEPPEQVH